MNRLKIGLVMMLVGLAVTLYFGAQLYQYVVLATTGTKSTATITGYKRKNGSGRLRPAFTFNTTEGKLVNTVNTDVIPQFFKKTGIKYYVVNEQVPICYKPDNPMIAVITNWTSWIAYPFVMLFGCLSMLIGFKKIVTKTEA